MSLTRIIGCICWTAEYTELVKQLEGLPVVQCDPKICGCTCHASHA